MEITKNRNSSVRVGLDVMLVIAMSAAAAWTTAQVIAYDSKKY
jgi:hypothetical protein